MNSSGFAAWKSLIPVGSNITGLSRALTLTGSGVLGIYANTTLVSVPQIQNFTSAPSANAPSSYPAGRYYIVEDNTQGSPSYNVPVTSEVIFPNYLVNGTSSNTLSTKFTSEVVTSSEFAFVALVIGVAGFIVLIYGFISKPKAIAAAAVASKPSASGKASGSKDPQKEKEIDELYKQAKLASKHRKRNE